MKINDPVKLPPANWEKIFTNSAYALVIITILAIIARARSLVVVFGVLDVICIICLLLIMLFAYIAKYNIQKSDESKDKKS